MATKHRVAIITIQFLAGLGIIATAALAIYAAQPWGDNYAYQHLFDYLLLIVFVTWAVSPYIYLFLSARRYSPHRVKSLIRVAVTLLLCAGGIAMVFDTVFIHPDAQGGLIFLSLPIYQWLVIGVLELTLVLLRARNAI